MNVLYNNKIRDEDERILYSSIKLKTIVQVTANGRIKGGTDPNCCFFLGSGEFQLTEWFFVTLLEKKLIPSKSKRSSRTFLVRTDLIYFI